MPRPKKLRPDSEIMASATPRLAATMMGPRALGKIWRNMIRPVLAPRTRADSTYSWFLISRKRLVDSLQAGRLSIIKGIVGRCPSDLLETFLKKSAHSFQTGHIPAAAVDIYDGLQINEKFFEAVFNLFKHGPFLPPLADNYFMFFLRRPGFADSWQFKHG